MTTGEKFVTGLWGSRFGVLAGSFILAPTLVALPFKGMSLLGASSPIPYMLGGAALWAILGARAAVTDELAGRRASVGSSGSY